MVGSTSLSPDSDAHHALRRRHPWRDLLRPGVSRLNDSTSSARGGLSRRGSHPEWMEEWDMAPRWIDYETEGNCAICGWHRPEDITVHHIDGNSTNSVYENEILLCHNCHKRHHDRKGLSDAEIRRKKGVLMLKTLTPYGVSALKIARRNPEGVVGTPFLLHHLIDLGLLTEEDTLMGYEGLSVQSVFAVTDRGKALVDEWL